jgi:hypothetical protein
MDRMPAHGHRACRPDIRRLRSRLRFYASVTVSFDVYLMRFRPGEPDAEAMADLLKPYVDGSRNLRFDDGNAAIYGLDDLGSGFMVNHVSGLQAWEVLVAVARQGGLAILPVGCPTAVTSEELISDLPEELRSEARVIHSGEDLLRVIESA